MSDRVSSLYSETSTLDSSNIWSDVLTYIDTATASSSMGWINVAQPHGMKRDPFCEAGVQSDLHTKRLQHREEACMRSNVAQPHETKRDPSRAPRLQSHLQIKR